MTEVDLSKYLWRSTENAFELLKKKIEGTQELPSKQDLYRLKNLIDEALFGKVDYASDMMSTTFQPEQERIDSQDDAASELSSDSDHATDDELPTLPASITGGALNVNVTSNIIAAATPAVLFLRELEVLVEGIPGIQCDAEVPTVGDGAVPAIASAASTPSACDPPSSTGETNSLISCTDGRRRETDATETEGAALRDESAASARAPLSPDAAEECTHESLILSHPTPSPEQEEPSPLDDTEGAPTGTRSACREWSQEEVDHILRTREESLMDARKRRTYVKRLSQQLGRSRRSVEGKIYTLTHAKASPRSGLHPPAPSSTPTGREVARPAPSTAVVAAQPTPLARDGDEAHAAVDRNDFPDTNKHSALSARATEEGELLPPPGRLSHPSPEDATPAEESDEILVPLSLLGKFTLEEVNFMLHVREEFGRTGRTLGQCIAFLSHWLRRPVETIACKMNTLRVTLRLPNFNTVYRSLAQSSPAAGEDPQEEGESTVVVERSEEDDCEGSVPPPLSPLQQLPKSQESPNIPHSPSPQSLPPPPPHSCLPPLQPLPPLLPEDTVPAAAGAGGLKRPYSDAECEHMHAETEQTETPLATEKGIVIVEVARNKPTAEPKDTRAIDISDERVPAAEQAEAPFATECVPLTVAEVPVIIAEENQLVPDAREECTPVAAPVFTAEELNVIHIAAEMHLRRRSTLAGCLQFLQARLSRPSADILTQMRTMKPTTGSAVSIALTTADGTPPLLLGTAALWPGGKSYGRTERIKLPSPAARKRLLPETQWSYAGSANKRRVPASRRPTGAAAVSAIAPAAAEQITEECTETVNPVALLNRLWRAESVTARAPVESPCGTAEAACECTSDRDTPVRDGEEDVHCSSAASSPAPQRILW